MKYLLCIFTVALAAGLFFVIAFENPLDRGDVIDFDKIGWNIVQGHGFSLSDSSPYKPTMFREPLYPYFLSIIFKLFGHNHTFVRLIQVVMFALTAIAVFLIANKIFDEKIAKYSAVFTALCPTLANYPSYILSETFFTFIISISGLFLIYMATDQRWLWVVLSAALLGTATLCKAFMLFSFVFVLLGMVILRRNIKHFILFVVVFVLILSPWSLRNKVLFGTYSLTLRSGIASWYRAERLDDSLAVMAKSAVYNFSEFLGKRFFPETNIEGKNFVLYGSYIANTKFIKLTRGGLSEVKADKIMKQISINKIKQRPFKYLAQTPLEFMKMLAFLYIPKLNDPHVITKFDSIKNGQYLLSGIRGFFRLLSYVVVVFAILGLYLGRNKWRLWLLPLSIIIYVNIINSLLFGFGRYAVPMIPFYLIFASVGIQGLKLRFNKMKAVFVIKE